MLLEIAFPPQWLEIGGAELSWKKQFEMDYKANNGRKSGKQARGFYDRQMSIRIVDYGL